MFTVVHINSLQYSHLSGLPKVGGGTTVTASDVFDTANLVAMVMVLTSPRMARTHVYDTYISYYDAHWDLTAQRPSYSGK